MEPRGKILMAMSKMARMRVIILLCILVLPVADGNLKQSAQLIMKLPVCLLMTTVRTISPYSYSRTAADDISQCEEIAYRSCHLTADSHLATSFLFALSLRVAALRQYSILVTLQPSWIYLTLCELSFHFLCLNQINVL